MNTSAKGRIGEARAARFLESAGYTVLERNLRIPGGEIDLVCRDGLILVFVEVKVRNGNTFGTALTAVDARKRNRLRRLAADYAQIVAPKAHVRFDVVAMDGDRMTLHRNAF